MAGLAVAPDRWTARATPASSNVLATPPSTDGGITLFVGMIWLAMVVITIWLVTVHGFVAPFMDEFPYLTPVLTGEQQITLRWLWDQYGDNRIPFAKVMNVTWMWVSNYDFRAAPVITVLLLGATSLALIWVARRVRGRQSPTDAVFPLILLSWSHWENLAWTMQLHFVIAHVVLLTLLLLIVVQRTYGRPLLLVLASLSVASLPALGPSTLAYVPALVVWLGYVGFLLWKDASEDGVQPLFLAAGLLVPALVMVGLFFLGYQKDPSAKTSPDLLSWGRGLLQAISMAFASDTVSNLSFTEASPPLWAFVAWPLLVLYLATAGLLIYAWVRWPAERGRAAGLLLFLGGAASMFVVFSWARGDGDQILTQPRYSIFAMPPLFCAYYAWLLYGPRPAAALVQTSLFATVGVLLPVNLEFGHNYTTHVAGALRNYVADLRAGIPAHVVADRHFYSMYVSADEPLLDEWYKRFLTKQMLELREAGIPPFRDMPPERATVRFPYRHLQPVESENIVWTGKQMRGEDLSAFVTYTLPQPEFVLAVLIRYRLERGPEPAAPGLVMWKNGVDSEFVEARSAPVILARAGLTTPEYIPAASWVWVNDTIDHLRFYPSNGPFALIVDEITVFVPKEEH